MSKIDIYRRQIEDALRIFIEQMGEKNRLRDACEYALLNGGKRLRPILAVMIADSLDCGLNVMPAALSVEFFHTASLIADDLPCMDDDDERRNRASLHKEFGESIAILASYTLIAEGYGGIYRNGRINPAADSLLCLEAATRCAGINGATNGQFLDLYPPDLSLNTVKKILYQKTVTLFEIAFIFGWVFGGGDVGRLEEVKKCAYHLGMAFQIADDLIDFVEDAGTVNIAGVCGKEMAQAMFEEQIQGFVTGLKRLGLWTESFEQVVQFLNEYGTKRERQVLRQAF